MLTVDPQTALREAVETHDVDLARLALEADADMSGLAKTGRPLLHQIGLQGDEDLLMLFMEYGVDLTQRSEHDYTILHAIAMGEDNTQERARMTLRVLQTKALPVDVEDKHKATAFGMAAMNGLAFTMQVLHRAGANINHPDFDGVRPAHVAVSKKSVKGLVKLLMLGADMDVSYRNGDTAHNLLAGDLQVAYARLQTYPSPDWDSPVFEKQALLEQDSEWKMSPLCNPEVMLRLDEVMRRLEANGERITREDWCRAMDPGNGEPIHLLENAAACGVIDQVFAELAAHDDMLRPEDLRDAEGNATKLANDLARQFVLDGMFKESLWHGKTKQEARALYDALPDDAKWQVTNLHQLSAMLDREQRQQGRAA